MNLETRARAAADGLRAANRVDTEAGLDRLRHSYRRRRTTRMVVAAAVVVGVVTVGAPVLDGVDRTAPPVDHGPVENLERTLLGEVVYGLERGRAGTPGSLVLSLPPLTVDDVTSFPAWQAFDQDTGRFLFTEEGGPMGTFDSVRTMRVLEPGLDAPVATIACNEQCNLMHSFGPGPDEVTTLVGVGDTRPHAAQVWGFDGTLRDEIDLSSLLKGRGLADIEWSPDGSRLAVTTFPGVNEPDCPSDDNWDALRAVVPNEAGVYLFDRDGGEPRLAYRQSGQPELDLPPVLSHLAWSPDGTRLGLVSSTYCRGASTLLDSPTLIAIDARSGRATTLYRFDDTYHDYTNSTHGFAWSPDGRRLVVTKGAGIAELSSDGQRATPVISNGHGPLAWLAPSDD